MARSLPNDNNRDNQSDRNQALYRDALGPTEVLRAHGRCPDLPVGNALTGRIQNVVVAVTMIFDQANNVFSEFVITLRML